jgi:hypothetical protein
VISLKKCPQKSLGRGILGVKCVGFSVSFTRNLLAQIWKYTTDAFDSGLGTFSRLAVSVRVDYIKCVYGITNFPEEERLLRDLLAQFEGIPNLPPPPPPRVILDLAHNLQTLMLWRIRGDGAESSFAASRI